MNQDDQDHQDRGDHQELGEGLDLLERLDLWEQQEEEDPLDLLVEAVFQDPQVLTGDQVRTEAYVLQLQLNNGSCEHFN